MEVAVSNRVIVRDNFGRLISELEAAGQATVDELLDQGVSISRDMAPVGRDDDPRTVPLRDGFFVQKTGRTSGFWGNFARHARPVEFGARPHVIVGNPTMRFYWESERRMWVPGLFGEPDIINHPGNDAQPYMRPAYRIITQRVTQIARRFYPGGRRG